MSAAADALRALRIFNPFTAAEYARDNGGVGVTLVRRAKQRGRGYRSAAWQVIRPGYKTDPDAHWTNHGNKTFLAAYGGPAEAEAAAVAYATARYAVKDWVKIPGLPRALFPAQDAAIIKAALKEGAQS